MVQGIPEKFQFEVAANIQCLVCNESKDTIVPHLEAWLGYSQASVPRGAAHRSAQSASGITEGGKYAREHVTRNNLQNGKALQKGIEFQLEVVAARSSDTPCNKCNSQQAVKMPTLNMPQYLLIRGGRNRHV